MIKNNPVKKAILLFCLSTLLTSCLNAQYTIWFNNKKKKIVCWYNLENENELSYTNQKGKTKETSLGNVFAITDSEGIENIIYQPGKNPADSLSLEEMRSYVFGINDGFEMHEVPWALAGGIIGGIPLPITVAPYWALVAFVKPNPEKFIIPEEYSENPWYLEGYKRGAKQKIVRNSLIGSGITISTLVATTVTCLVFIVATGGFDM